MPAKRNVDPKKAFQHLKSIYNKYLKEGGDPKRFTIRQYNKLNEDPHMYIDVYVKKLGGWNQSLEKAKIPLGFRQYKNYSDEDIAKYVKKVYNLYLKDNKDKSKAKYKGMNKTFHMKDFQKYSKKADNQFSLAVILKRFGSWSNILKKLDIPIGRSRGLTHEEITEHVKKVYDIFGQNEGEEKVFSKDMYDKYNFVENYYISSKLIERRFGSWLLGKKKMRIY